MKEFNNENIKFEDSYENEKQELINIANDKFGSDFFRKLEELTKDNDQGNGPNYYRYSLKISTTGAFNAC